MSIDEPVVVVAYIKVMTKRELGERFGATPGFLDWGCRTPEEADELRGRVKRAAVGAVDKWHREKFGA